MIAKTDVLIIGGGLAGLVAANEAIKRKRKVIIVDQEGENSLGGQAFWSLGGLMMVDTPEQRRMKIKDSHQLALSDWIGSAQFDRPEDHWPTLWAEAFVEYSAGSMREDLHRLGMRWFPVVGWAERGGGSADGHGNSVPRFHITWGTGPGVVKPYVELAKQAIIDGDLDIRFRHRVSNLVTTSGGVSGASGEILAPSTVERGQQSSREFVGEFEIHAESVVVTSGGIGGNLDMVRSHWPVERLGEAPENMICGVPHHVDGRMQNITREAGGAIINADRMWHYTEGVKNWNPIWPNHAIRVIPGPSSMWFDAEGNRMPAPFLPGFDTLGTLKHIQSTGYDYSWFVLTQKIIEKEFALSGSEQNPDLTSGKWMEVLKGRLGKGATAPVEAFKQHGEDFIISDNLEDLVVRMNKLTASDLISHDKLKSQIIARDLQIDNPFSKDAQITAILGARNYLGDKLIRTARPHKILDPQCGPLIAVRLHLLTRKSLGGLHTNLQSQVLGEDGNVVPGLYAAGEVAGFGGGGYHGYNALEGTFLGGCIFSGLKAGQSA